MPVTVQGPDGKTYQFPDGTDKGAAVRYFKKKGIGVKAPGALEPHGGPLDFFRGAGSGIVNTVMHPVQTIESMGQPFVAAGASVGGGYPGTVPIIGKVGREATAQNEQARGAAQAGQTEQGKFAAAHPAFTAGSVAGPAIVFGGAEKVIPRVVPPAFRSGLEMVTGTGPRATRAAAEEVAADNLTATEKAAKANEAQDIKRQGDLQKHFEKTQQVKESNAQAGAEPARKEALTHGVEKLDAEFQDSLKQTAKDVKGQADAKYEALRAATADSSVPSSQLADAVKQAESKLQGSSENIKVFRDILSRAPEGGEDAVVSGGMKFGPGTPLYESVKATNEGIPNASEPVSFSDLQGYYTELGSKLSAGNLLGDVYQATKALQESVGQMMQNLADQAGVGPQLKDARQYYADYMRTFRDHNSPLYKAIKAQERGKSIAALAGKDQTGIAALAKYNPELAARANTIRGYQAEAKALPSKPKATKPLPKLEPKPAPVTAETKTLGPEEIRAAKQKGLEKRINVIRHRGEWIASGVAGYRLMANIIHGELGAIPQDLFEGGIAVGGVEGLARLLENPRVQRLLTDPTPRDVAQIPPELRRDLGPVVAQAQRQGVKVSPILLTALGASPRHPVLSAKSPVQ